MARAGLTNQELQVLEARLSALDKRIGNGSIG